MLSVSWTPESFSSPATEIITEFLSIGSVLAKNSACESLHAETLVEGAELIMLSVVEYI